MHRAMVLAVRSAVHTNAKLADGWTDDGMAERPDCSSRSVSIGKERLLREERLVILCKMRREKSKRALQAQFAPLHYECALLDENHVLALS
jgi:hypothetical protein